jgi:putative flavoprotein involved in K+ transport
MLSIVDRKLVTAPADAQSWLDRFAATLQAQDAAAAAELFLEDGLWRDVPAFTWNLLN